MKYKYCIYIILLIILFKLFYKYKNNIFENYNNIHNNRNVFLYWVGKEYKLITLLRYLIYLHSKNGKAYNIILINNSNINKYINNLPTFFYDLCPAHQADYTRVNVICDYGGIWLDSDTLVMNSLDSLFNLIDEKDGFFVKENNQYLSNGIFGSKKNTKFMKEWKKRVESKLNLTNGKIEWTEIGNKMLQNIFNSDSSLLNNYKIFDGLDNIYPVNWNNCVNEFLSKPYDNYKNIIRDFQPLLILVNSVYKELENKSYQEILNGNMPLNYFINKSFENAGVYDYKSITNFKLNFL